MGASSWRYYAPYHSDPAVALDELQRTVFWRKEYTLPPQTVDELLLPFMRRPRGSASGPGSEQAEMQLRVKRAIETGDYTGLSPGIRQFAESMRARGLGTNPKREKPRPRPKSIAEVREQAGQSGTQSILDIVRISKRAARFAASPLSVDLLRRTFGTERPTRELVEQHWEKIGEELARWQARFFVIYRDSGPHEYAFIGSSGD